MQDNTGQWLCQQLHVSPTSTAGPAVLMSGVLSAADAACVAQWAEVVIHAREREMILET